VLSAQCNILICFACGDRIEEGTRLAHLGVFQTEKGMCVKSYLGKSEAELQAREKKRKEEEEERGRKTAEEDEARRAAAGRK
jgi:hypothetical protein